MSYFLSCSSRGDFLIIVVYSVLLWSEKTENLVPVYKPVRDTPHSISGKLSGCFSVFRPVCIFRLKYFYGFLFLFFSLFSGSLLISPPVRLQQLSPASSLQPHHSRLQLLPRRLRPIPHLPNCFSKFTSMVEASSFTVHPQQWSLVMGLWSLDMEFKEKRNFCG
jgi:hypothetical protein